MEDAESQGLVAKALIAMENHGGGFLLFGYKEDDDTKLTPDAARPASLEPYLSDALNNIIKKRAEPTFHVEVTLQRHPETGEDYPLVRVPGTSKVPVRSDSATAGGSLRQHVYYIRAPGPESRGPLNGAEWDVLLRRAITNQREEIVGLLRSILPATSPVPVVAPPSESEKLSRFADEARARWNSLNEQLAAGANAKISLGHFSFAARIIGTSRNLDASKVREINEAARRYTGWPVLLTLHRDDGKPRLVDGCIEAWLGKTPSADVGHADFWRIDPINGNFFPLRGYQEDALEKEGRSGKAGTLFEVTLPIWRLAEFLLRVLDVADQMYEPSYDVVVECEWTGLADRKLFVFNMRRYVPGLVTAANAVKTTGTFSQDSLRELLPEAVKTLTKPLYEHFEFFAPPDSLFVEELADMTKNRY